MKYRKPSLFGALFFCASFLLSGCQTIPSLTSAQPSPEAQKLDNQTSDFNRTVVESAVAGALIGGLTGLLVGDNKESAAKGMVAGAIGGAAFGYYIAGQKREFANKEQALNSIAQDLQETNNNLKTMVNTSERMLAEDRKRVERLRKQIASGQAQQSSNNELIAQLKSDRKVLGKAITGSEKRYQTSIKNMKSYEQQFGVEGIEQLEALVLNYRTLQNILTSIERSMDQLIKDAETKS